MSNEELQTEGFLPGRIHYDGKRFYEWSDSTSGWNAAYSAVGKLPRDNGDAPLRLEFKYTVEQFCYQTDETYQCGDQTVPCGIHYRVGIRQWSRKRNES